METLQIKCPVCGIVLEVRNSKDEAVKRIVCPNCKKQLSITFRQPAQSQENQKPVGYLYHENKNFKLEEGQNPLPWVSTGCIQIRLIRLADGNSKCLISVLSDDHSVSVNGHPLQSDDEVILTFGDRFKVDDKEIIYDVEGKKFVKSPEAGTTPPPPVPPVPPKKPQKRFNWSWIVVPAVIGVLGLSAYRLYPVLVNLPHLLLGSIDSVENNKDSVIAIPIEKHVKGDNGINDRPEKKKTAGEAEAKKTTPKPEATKTATKAEATKTATKAEATKTATKPEQKVAKPNNENQASTNYASLSNYELEMKAGHGDVKAQLVLGKRWVNIGDSINVTKGVSYLRQAARNGSTDANRSLQEVRRKLQRSAASGNIHARNLLEALRMN